VNLIGWADAAWVDGSWVPNCWGVPAAGTATFLSIDFINAANATSSLLATVAISSLVATVATSSAFKASRFTIVALPSLPANQQFIVDDIGNYLIDDIGNYLTSIIS